MITGTAVPLDAERQVTVQGQERSYLLHLPGGLDVSQAHPLVFVFHGYSESGVNARLYTKLDAFSDVNGFVVVYPEGFKNSWNASVCCGDASQNNVDDQAFIRQVIADVGSLVSLDAKRIYATGFSNGALLSYRLACEMSDTFAAVAPVAGSLVTNPCKPSQAVSLFAMNGMRDGTVPYDGNAQFPSVPGSVETLARLDGCADAPTVTKDGVLTHTIYTGCKAGTSVELLTNDVVGHNWPSQYLMTPPLSQLIWDFFAAHPKP